MFLYFLFRLFIIIVAWALQFVHPENEAFQHGLRVMRCALVLSFISDYLSSYVADVFGATSDDRIAVQNIGLAVAFALSYVAIHLEEKFGSFCSPGS